MWNLKYSNTPCHTKEQLLIHKEHLERLIQVKEKIDNGHPVDPLFLKIKANKLQNERDNSHRLQYENNILFSRMHSILKRPSNYNLNIYKPQYCPALDKARFNWTTRQKKKDLLKRNDQLFARFNAVRTFYPIAAIEQQTGFYEYLGSNMDHKANNPNIDYVPYPVFHRKVIEKMKAARNQIAHARERPKSCMRRCTSAYSISHCSESFLNSKAIKPYSNRSLLSNKSTANASCH